MPPSPPAKLLQVEIQPGWWLSGARTLYLEKEKTLVVADIHWGYAHSHRQIGNLLPLWGNAEIAARLRLLLDHYRPERMIWLGDSLHTPLAHEFAEAFLDEISSLEVIILAGNHDRSWKKADRTHFQLAGCVFHHGDRPWERDEDLCEVMGHIHPAIAWSDGAGLRLRLPALVQGPRRIILPSFSDWSSGAVWNHQLEDDEKLWAVSARKIWPLTRAHFSRPYFGR